MELSVLVWLNHNPLLFSFAYHVSIQFPSQVMVSSHAYTYLKIKMHVYLNYLNFLFICEYKTQFSNFTTGNQITKSAPMLIQFLSSVLNLQCQDNENDLQALLWPTFPLPKCLWDFVYWFSQLWNHTADMLAAKQ